MKAETKRHIHINKYTIISYLILVMMITLIIFTASCEVSNNIAEDIRGDISGNTYTIDTFDNNGVQTLKTHGSHISMSYNTYRERTYSDGHWGYVDSISSVITVTIDGKEFDTCGDTCIFYEDGLTPDYDFRLDEIDSQSDGSVWDSAIFAKSLNKAKRFIGKPMVVVIKSQTGSPIYVFSGNSIYWEVCKDLPKTTKISIDGKAMYIHRANFQLIDRDLID